ncbi:MAG: hypothetical protein F6K00_17435 [Leptolyngbya sp. SIOISBB]|nr:hypothetical protein [Leptolyngbya sp. SIOISBB]
MQLLFLIGVEGTGHHMMGRVLSGYKTRPDSIVEGRWHDLLLERWNYESCLKCYPVSSLGFKEKSLKDELKAIIKEYEEAHYLNLFEYTSFPYDQPREALRRPDILEFHDLLNDIIEIKYLVMYRNPITATYSAVRRNFTDNIYLQAKIAESNYIYIERQLSQISPTYYRTLHFEDFLDDPQYYGQKLAAWWNLDYETIENSFPKLRKPAGFSGIPENSLHFLESFFNEKRLSQWKDFYYKHKI